MNQFYFFVRVLVYIYFIHLYGITILLFILLLSLYLYSQFFTLLSACYSASRFINSIFPPTIFFSISFSFLFPIFLPHALPLLTSTSLHFSLSLPLSAFLFLSPLFLLPFMLFSYIFSLVSRFLSPLCLLPSHSFYCSRILLSIPALLSHLPLFPFCSSLPSPMLSFSNYS